MDIRNHLLNLYMNIKLTINPEVVYFRDIQSVHRNFFLIDKLNVPVSNRIQDTIDKRFVNLDNL